MTQLFISYSRVDIPFVELFYKRLQHSFPDLKIWYDKAPHGLIGGGNWWNDILSKIAESDVFIYILSNESVNSVYCQAEFTEARRLQKRIITVQARDRTELNDDLSDIQSIDMKDGVDSPGAIPSLVAAVNLRLKEAGKYRNVRPLWKPATPKPNKEIPPTRAGDAPDVTTPVLSRPASEVAALRIQREAEQMRSRHTLLGIGITIVVVILLAILIALIPGPTNHVEITETQLAVELTQKVLALTATENQVATTTQQSVATETNATRLVPSNTPTLHSTNTTIPPTPTATPTSPATNTTVPPTPITTPPATSTIDPCIGHISSATTTYYRERPPFSPDSIASNTEILVTDNVLVEGKRYYAIWFENHSGFVAVESVTGIASNCPHIVRP